MMMINETTRRARVNLERKEYDREQILLWETERVRERIWRDDGRFPGTNKSWYQDCFRVPTDLFPNGLFSIKYCNIFITKQSHSIRILK